MPTDLPDTYWVSREPEGSLAILKSYYAALQELGYAVLHDGQRSPSELKGRGNLEEFHLPGQTLVIRRFRRGGLARLFSQDRFLNPERPFAEIRLSDRLKALGFQTPRLVAARARRLGIMGYRLEVVTERLQGSQSLGAALKAVRSQSTPARQALALLAQQTKAFGALVARLHAVGFVHSDLQPENILWVQSQADAGQDPLWVLDLDRSRFETELPLALAVRAKNLWRLWRYILRQENRGPKALRPTDYARFLKAYEPSKTQRRQLGQALQELRTRRSKYHRPR